MKRAVARSSQAQRDFDEILDYFLAPSERAARKFALGVTRICKLLAAHPHLGRSRDELRPGLRSVVIGDCILFYRVTERTIKIVRSVTALAISARLSNSLPFPVGVPPGRQTA